MIAAHSATLATPIQHGPGTQFNLNLTFPDGYDPADKWIAFEARKASSSTPVFRVTEASSEVSYTGQTVSIALKPATANEITDGDDWGEIVEVVNQLLFKIDIGDDGDTATAEYRVQGDIAILPEHGGWDADSNVTSLTLSFEASTVSVTFGGPGPAGEAGAAGQGLPAGGTTGQIPTKASATDYDVEWTNAGAGDMIAANNLSDLANAATARTNLGLGNVDNTADAAKPISTATQTALDLKAAAADLTSHTGNTSNPHSVTKAQVGLANVDNTADADKPISTATQAALDLKVDDSTLITDIDAALGSTAWQTPGSGFTESADYNPSGNWHFSGSAVFHQSVLGLEDTGNDHHALVNLAENLTANRVLSIVMGDADRTLTLAGNASVSGTNTGNETAASVRSLGFFDTTNDGAGSGLDADLLDGQHAAAFAAAADLTSHTGNTSNPHSVTKAQVGLANVDNTADADKPVSTATQTALDLKAAAADLTSHTGNTSNPHSVTKAQVGLGNVDNTADADKPVSTATQTALDAKANTTDPFWVEVVLTGSGVDIATGTAVAYLTHTVAGTITGFKLVCDPANEPSAAAVQVDMNSVDLSTGAATTRLSAVAQIATGANVSTGGTISGTQTVDFGDQTSFDIDQGSDGKELRALVQITPS